MYYPVNIINDGQVVCPIFRDNLKGEPFIFDFSSDNPQTLEYNKQDFDEFQKQIFSQLDEAGASWGIGKYLEERKNLLIEYPQMIEEKRYYHAGLDIIVPKGRTLSAPVDGFVYRTGMDAGKGNYGGYIILEHTINSTIFYSLYGHLDSGFRVKEGDFIKQAEPFASTGSHEDSGGWFSHTHLQILTEKAVREERTLQGYVTLKDLEIIETIFPSPYFLFRY
jgi:murein DD-endopeptidase MepM/ murein hydrolase activator NlpD